MTFGENARASFTTAGTFLPSPRNHQEKLFSISETRVSQASSFDIAVEFEKIRITLESKAFVHIDSVLMRQLLVWQGASEEDLGQFERGEIHPKVAQDPEPSMHFRQIAFHRVVIDENTKALVNADQPAVTQIADSEIASDDGAKVFFERAGTRKWPLPPTEYANSSVSKAMGNLNALLLPNVHHPQSNINHKSRNVVNDQVLIRVNKATDSEESPTPEGVHQDGTEISSVTMINRSNVTSGGETRIWTLAQPTGNYSSAAYGTLKNEREASIVNPDGFDWGNCLYDHALQSTWETVYFNDRKIKHEARGFDGIRRPCTRDVIVNFVRKPLYDGSDKMRDSRGEITAIE